MTALNPGKACLLLLLLVVDQTVIIQEESVHHKPHKGFAHNLTTQVSPKH